MILPHRGRWPKIHETAFVAPSADIIGEVEIGAQSSVWFQSVLRGDVGSIKIGKRTSVQDLTMVHTTGGLSTVEVGDEVTIGHHVTLHGCKIGDRVLIGMGVIVLDNAEIGAECILGAGALITKNTKIPPRSLVLGAPAKVVRPLNDEELASLVESANRYVKHGAEYQAYVRGPARLGDNKRELEEFSNEMPESEES